MPDTDAQLVARTQSGDTARHLIAGCEGERRLDLILTGDEQAIDEVDAGRFDRHEDLPRPGARVFPLFDGEE